MKGIKCPMCGEKPQFATKDIDEIEVCQILCKCGLATEVNEFWLHPKDDPEEDELRAWKDWEKLVSKFPPIMRVQVGDKLTYFDNLYHRQSGIVLSVDTTSMRILIENGSNPTSEMIIKWPWELEQKGGEEQ